MRKLENEKDKLRRQIDNLTKENAELIQDRENFQVIPGNLQKYVSTNRNLLQCKTLPAHFSNNMMVHCLLNFI